ncbi:unnamed protein product, partial [Rotaria sp. Silwood1]
MAKSNWILLCVVNSLDDVKAVVVVPDDNPNSITVMFKNTHNHSDCNQTFRLPSPLRQSVSQYVRAGLTESQ